MYAPDIGVVSDMFIYNEAHLSCKIDTIDAPFSDLFIKTKNSSCNRSIILNYIKAIKFIYDGWKKERISSELLCELHKVVLTLYLVMKLI